MTSEIRPSEAPSIEAPAIEALTDLASTGRLGVRPKLLWALLVAYGAVWATFFPVVLSAMPAQMQRLAPDDYTTYYSISLTVSSLVGMFAGPIIGRLSDRSTSRFGRRRPWLLAAMAIGILGMMLVGFSPTVLVYVVGTVLTQIGFSGAAALQLAMFTEQVPREKRGALGAMIGVTTAVATIVGVLIAGVLVGQGQIGAAFVACSVLGVVGVLNLTRMYPDTRSTVAERINLAELARAFWLNPRRHPDFAWAWLSRFTVYLSAAGVTTYQLFYLTDQIGVSASDAAGIYVTLGTAVQTVATVVGALLGGPLSDRVGRRKPFVAAAAAVAFGGLVILALSTTVAGYLVGVLFMGIALGAYISVDIALITAVLPSEVTDAGKDLGLVNIATSLPNSLAPAIAPVLLSIGLFSVVGEANGRNYTMLFLGSAIFALISVASVFKVRGVK